MGPEYASDVSPLPDARSSQVIHPDRMGATPLRQQPRLGLAVYRAEYVAALGLLAVSVGLVILVMAWDAPTGFLVATTALLIGTGAFCVWTRAAVFYQARAGARSLASPPLVWGPPLVMRIALVVSAASFGVVVAAMATVNTPPSGLLILAVAFVATALMAWRFFVARCEANQWGIRYTFLSTIRIPWIAVRSLEPRGKSAFFQRIVVITEAGRKRTLWVVDPRVPLSNDSARLLIAELEAVRRSAVSPGA
jgi:hypothetical protein